jgi:TolB-like protein/Tfp pilus assembly protein PilF
MSADQEQEYFSDGISEEILNALTQVNGLKVVGRTSSFQFKGRNEDLRVIGDKLGVAHLLEGSIRKQGDNVRITAQLIKVADGYHLWSQTYDRKLTDMFAVQDEISAAIAQALSAQLMHVGPNPRAASIDPAAYDLYLRARQLMRKRTAPALREAGRLFDAASAIAPDFDAAYSGRARALSIVWNFAGGVDANTDTLVADGMRAATRALEINPRNAEAHSALGYMQFVNLWQWEQGLRQTRLAITLAPNDAEIANFAGDLFRFAGDLDAGLKWERRAIELDPLLPINHSDLSWALQIVNECRAAIVPARKALELDPNQAVALDALSRAQICVGEFEPAEVSLARFDSLEPNSPFLLDARARLAVRRGREDDARDVLRALIVLVDAGAVFHYAVAQTQAQLGDGEAAGRSLEQAYLQRDPYFPSDDLYLLPEEWPSHPAILAALDKPELNALFAMRRAYLRAQKQRGFSRAGAPAPPLSSPTR